MAARTRSPSAAAPSPAPRRRKARNELKPATAFRITARKTRLRRPRPGAVGDLDPDGAVSGDDRDRDRLPGSTRPAVPDTVAEDLADQQDSHVPARVPGAEYRRDECSGGPRRLRPASVTVIGALRGLVRGGKYDRTAAGELIADLIILPIERWHTSSLLPRIWELRENLTPCDAAYVAPAEMTGATLLTGDERITAAPATRCEIRIIK
ncbi:MAG TPA: type II toxin-antitoxin system VapC family toxin [Streptosporangiaceae bacterium]|nr:type II toxin-antitoxin system VapC family toxin [Streptosporangiaceae bacterium]